ncbi:hypothetical protein AFCDBAGC_1638 [Methylobacterium cerastii]|uniref:Uncharacterized protein n=1 Tax=Methylobacterium cerastii TaxID=932741 RepID=A0ABQ4QF12_9HYPH|nr:hypothetical protein [Methylobacterium cerastii]GJD43783.1 hypothetical protein AFCDBAGC_1638 [Methylobacterium cerastii]
MPASLKPTPTVEAIRWDPHADAFVRLTLGICGRILARHDLEPAEKRAALRHLFLDRTTTEQRRAAGALFGQTGLLLGPEPSGNRTEAAVLTQRFLAGGADPAVSGMAERLDLEVRAVLVLAWGLGLARVAPGQALPQLEDLDADLPYMPPEGPAPGPGFNDVGAILAEAEAACTSAAMDIA